MGGINRRNFIKNVAIGGAVLGWETLFLKHLHMYWPALLFQMVFKVAPEDYFFVCESFYVLKPNP